MDGIGAIAGFTNVVVGLGEGRIQMDGGLDSVEVEGTWYRHG